MTAIDAPIPATHTPASTVREPRPTRQHEEGVHTEESARHPSGAEVVGDDRRDRERPQAVERRLVREAALPFHGVPPRPVSEPVSVAPNYAKRPHLAEPAALGQQRGVRATANSPGVVSVMSSVMKK